MCPTCATLNVHIFLPLLNVYTFKGLLNVYTFNTRLLVNFVGIIDNFPTIFNFVLLCFFQSILTVIRLLIFNVILLALLIEHSLFSGAYEVHEVILRCLEVMGAFALICGVCLFFQLILIAALKEANWQSAKNEQSPQAVENRVITTTRTTSNRVQA